LDENFSRPITFRTAMQKDANPICTAFDEVPLCPFR